MTENFECFAGFLVILRVDLLVEAFFEDFVDIIITVGFSDEVVNAGNVKSPIPSV
jgi:hypothetical protein